MTLCQKTHCQMDSLYFFLPSERSLLTKSLSTKSFSTKSLDKEFSTKSILTKSSTKNLSKKSLSTSSYIPNLSYGGGGGAPSSFGPEKTNCLFIEFIVIHRIMLCRSTPCMWCHFCDTQILQNFYQILDSH